MWTERVIGNAVCRQLLDRRCVVLVPNCNWTGHECDVLAVTTDLRVIDIEVKISRADLKADAAKDKWWHDLTWRQRADGVEPQPRQWPPKVWKHYYALPADIWKPELEAALPTTCSGVLLLAEGRGRLSITCARRAKPNRDAARLEPAAVMDIARLANLRMWSALEQRG